MKRFTWSIILSITLPIAATVASAYAQDDDLEFAKSKFVMPFAAGAFPTGRFGETDLDADPPKSGNESGYLIGGGIGYFVSEFFALGFEASYAQFPLDFGPDLEAQFPTEKSHTSVLMGQLSGRFFWPNSFEHWRPYALVGFGFGRPKGTIDYVQPFIIPLPDDQGTVEVKSLESTVSTVTAVTGGLGVMVPISGSFSLMLEPRYTTLSTEGADRTDEFISPDGDLTEIEDTAKSNTNWWEIRGGLILTIR